MRIIYSFLIILITPWIVFRLWWRGRREPTYRRRIAERFGWYRGTGTARSIWLHACSLGEVNAAAPLITALRQQCPDLTLWVTTMTPTGSAQVVKLFGEQVHHVYLPYDYPGAVKRFLKYIQPKLAIILETELWPNLIYYTSKQNCPLLLANARISPRAFKQYKKIQYLLMPYLNLFNNISVQSQQDYNHFLALGVADDKLVCTGNLKYDLTLPKDLIQLGYAWKENIKKPVWIAASTHLGEEEICLQAHRAIPGALLILVPRHPTRFVEVAELALSMGYNVGYRSQIKTEQLSAIDVLIGDSMGEMFAYYACADVAFVGGSLVDIGGHNLLEPAALSLPILTGPYTQNCQAIARALVDAGACKIVNNTQELITALTQSRATESGVRAHAVFKQYQGALEKQLALCLSFLDFS